jgi:hypothetical protein
MPELTLQEWVDIVCRETGLDPSLVDIATVLDLAKDAAHGIARPAAPLTTFMAGLLIGRDVSLGVPGDSDRTRPIDAVRGLIKAVTSTHEDLTDDGPSTGTPAGQ